MSGVDEQFLQRLRATFRVEAAEHLQTIGTGLRGLAKATSAEGRALIEGMFRAAHSLKGAARAVNLAEIESLCQTLEGHFAEWKHRPDMPSAPAVDVAYGILDRISQLPDMRTLKPGDEPGMRVTPSPAGVPAVALHASAPAPENAPPANALPPTTVTTAMPGDTETVRIAVRSLDERLLESEELLAAKLATDQWLTSTAELTNHVERWRKEWQQIEPRMRTLQRLAGHTGTSAGQPELHALSEFLGWSDEHHRSLEARVAALRRGAAQDRLLIGKLVDELLENSKKLIMLPLATQSALLVKVVRDLCRDQGKEAELVIRGDDIVIDKRILEELKDPLIHLLRNCVDHGVETPGVRRQAGKPAQASIVLEIATLDEHRVQISISDDGAGVDAEKVQRAAKQSGLLESGVQQLEPAAALALVFESAVSTSPTLTTVSGRGLGLAIVREKTEKLGGHVAIESRLGQGTTIRMTLPLTLATFRGVLFKVARRLFILPTAQIQRAIRFQPDEVRTVEGRKTLELDGRAVALVALADVLQLPPAPRPACAANTATSTPALVIAAGEQRIAFVVEEVLDEREILVKRFSRPLSRVRNIAGATILASGEVAPILNVQDLIKSARHASAMTRPVPAPAQRSETTAKRILIAEDSITSRMLLKAILESVGHEVRTAVDGVDAFTTLRSERFDLVVSDVEMPRMNGFDLTSRIRADRNLAELPVVLVTALDSREDRERGIDVGANAYLVKSSLDQSNLLEAVRRLA